MKEKVRGKFRNGKILRKLARALVGFRPQLSAGAKRLYGPSPPRLFRGLRPGGCRLCKGQNYVESPVIQRGIRHVGHGGRLRSASEGVVVVRRWPEIPYPAAPSHLYGKPPLGLRFGLLSPVPSKACARPSCPFSSPTTPQVHNHHCYKRPQRPQRPTS